MYICKRCGYSTKIKGNLKNHFRRKRPCKPIIKDISIEDLKKEFDIEIETIDIKSNHEETCEKIFTCEYCSKEFKHRQSKFTHQKKCEYKDKNIMINFFKEQLEEMKKREDNLKEEWKQERIKMKLEIENLLEKVSTNNITNNTINIKEQNIILNNFGNENIDYLKESYFNFLLKAPFSSVPRLLKDLHFHPNHPENHNVKITNKKLPYASVWEGNKWNLRDKNQVIENMVVKGFNIIDGQNDTINNLETEKHKRYDDFQNKFHGMDKDLHKTLNKETEIILINNKD